MGMESGEEGDSTEDSSSGSSSNPMTPIPYKQQSMKPKVQSPMPNISSMLNSLEPIPPKPKNPSQYSPHTPKSSPKSMEDWMTGKINERDKSGHPKNINVSQLLNSLQPVPLQQSFTGPSQHSPTNVPKPNSKKPGMERDAENEKNRSIAYKDIVCHCGFDKPLDHADGEGGKKTVKTGHKKRSRCKECKGCLAPKCMNCKFCINPKLKKPCQDKICLFPIVPKCPCFA